MYRRLHYGGEGHEEEMGCRVWWVVAITYRRLHYIRRLVIMCRQPRAHLMNTPLPEVEDFEWCVPVGTHTQCAAVSGIEC